MEALECNVVCPIALAPFALAEMRYALSNVADNGRMYFDRLGVKD